MATTPALDDNHSSDHNNHYAPTAIIQSSSSSLPTLLSQTHSSSLTKTDATLDEKTMTSLDEVPNSSTTQNIAHQSNNHETSIKVKRCKHGRIKLKDPSKKKHGQQSDKDASITGNSTTEASYNRISGNRHHIDDGTDKQKSKNTDLPLNNDLSKEQPPRVSNQSTGRLSHLSIKTDNRSKFRTSEFDVLDQAIKSGLKDYRHISGRDEKDSHTSHKNRSRSRSRSRTPPRRSAKRDSPSRKSRRISTSPERSSSRELSRSSRHRRYSPSPSSRRRGSSSPSHKTTPRKRKRGGRRKSRRRRSVERRKLSETCRRYRRSPYSRSPSSARRASRSRSMTPVRQNRREISHSPSVDRPNYDSYSVDLRHGVKESIFDKLSQRRPLNGESLVGTLATQKIDHKEASSKPLNDHSSKSDSAPPVISTKSENKSMTPQRVLPAGPNYLPRLAQADPDPMEHIPARSPTTPSNGDSAPSDVYDPEEPVLPLSPVDSLPVIEKTDDDVPSSAVQLNQQEKYLQKFHRQERVVEEVKIALRPFYQNRTINKEQYKDVLRKAVPKICHSKDGEISPVKIRSLVDAYVRKMQN